jgi:hypothetical protein
MFRKKPTLKSDCAVRRTVGNPLLDGYNPVK